MCERRRGTLAHSGQVDWSITLAWGKKLASSQAILMRRIHMCGVWVRTAMKRASLVQDDICP
eukprot:13228356-Alexandrium_andersonii.AAC.1